MRNPSFALAMGLFVVVASACRSTEPAAPASAAEATALPEIRYYVIADT